MLSNAKLAQSMDPAKLSEINAKLQSLLSVRSHESKDPFRCLRCGETYQRTFPLQDMTIKNFQQEEMIKHMSEIKP
jgi:hypothetical protein